MGSSSVRKPMVVAIEEQEVDWRGTVAMDDGGALAGNVCGVVAPKTGCAGDGQGSPLSAELPRGWGADGPGSGWPC